MQFTCSTCNVFLFVHAVAQFEVISIRHCCFV